jgi:hypothetical protein
MKGTWRHRASQVSQGAFVQSVCGKAIFKRKIRPPTEKELTDPYWAYSYAADVIKGRFPEGEATIARGDPYWSYGYAKYVINGRFPEGEEAVAKSESRDEYLKTFPEAKDDWILNGWLDWLDT